MMLPDFVLMPDSSYLIANVNDYQDNYGWKNETLGDLRKYGIQKTHPDILAKLDTAIFYDEDLAGRQDGLDSISHAPNILGTLQFGKGLYLEYHIGDDSVVVDQVRSCIR